VLLVMAGAAMVSKYVLIRNRRHVFNPAAFGVVVSALVLGGWDDFRTLGWIVEVKYPELVLKQTKSLLYAIN